MVVVGVQFLRDVFSLMTREAVLSSHSPIAPGLELSWSGAPAE